MFWEGKKSRRGVCELKKRRRKTSGYITDTYQCFFVCKFFFYINHNTKKHRSLFSNFIFTCPPLFLLLVVGDAGTMSDEDRPMNDDQDQQEEQMEAPKKEERERSDKDKDRKSSRRDKDKGKDKDKSSRRRYPLPLFHLFFLFHQSSTIPTGVHGREVGNANQKEVSVFFVLCFVINIPLTPVWLLPTKNSKCSDSQPTLYPFPNFPCLLCRFS